jgi:hypothetical protein
MICSKLLSSSATGAGFVGFGAGFADSPSPRGGLIVVVVLPRSLSARPPPLPWDIISRSCRFLAASCSSVSAAKFGGGRGAVDGPDGPDARARAFSFSFSARFFAFLFSRAALALLLLLLLLLLLDEEEEEEAEEDDDDDEDASFFFFFDFAIHRGGVCRARRSGDSDNSTNCCRMPSQLKFEDAL